jgi:hypothetical protein
VTNKCLHFMAFKVLRQCPLVLLVKLQCREGKESGNEKGRALGVDFVTM